MVYFSSGSQSESEQPVLADLFIEVGSAWRSSQHTKRRATVKKERLREILVAPELGWRTDLVPQDIRGHFPRESERNGAWISGGILVGLTAGVNDESAKLVPDFQVTRYELGILAKYYFNLQNDLMYFWDWTSQYGSDDSRMISFAASRLHSIAEILGQDECDDLLSKDAQKWKNDFATLRSQPRCGDCGVKYDPDSGESCPCRDEDSP
jgi:hypothetical protein